MTPPGGNQWRKWGSHVCFPSGGGLLVFALLCCPLQEAWSTCNYLNVKKISAKFKNQFFTRSHTLRAPQPQLWNFPSYTVPLGSSAFTLRVYHIC